MKLILNKNGLLLTAGTIFILAFLFLKTYMETIVGIPSPEFEAVRRFYWWLIVFGCGFLACLGGTLWILKDPPLFLFPGTVVVLGLFYMLVLTPFSTPDESAHFVSAYRLSSQFMGKQAVADDGFLAQATEEEKERISRGANVLVRSGDDVSSGLYPIGISWQAV